MSAVMISDLKAHLSEHLRAVRRGQTVIVMDRSNPVARIVPYSGPMEVLSFRPPKRPFGSTDKPEPASVSAGVLAQALASEREQDR